MLHEGVCGGREARPGQQWREWERDSRSPVNPGPLRSSGTKGFQEGNVYGREGGRQVQTGGAGAQGSPCT